MKKELQSNESLYLAAKDAYYKGEPIMTDQEFDLLEDLLYSQDSFVVNLIGSKSKSKKKDTAKHLSPMLSLKRIKFETNYTPWTEFQNWSTGLPSNVFVFEPKLDGNAINLIYDNGLLIKVLSRGDGAEGQNYIDRLSVPKLIKGFSGEIRGEAVVDQYLFNEKWKNDQDKQGYKNPRNFVAGVLNSDWNEKDKDKYTSIDFVAFEIVGRSENGTKSQLIKWGFEVLDGIIVAEINKESDLVNVYKSFELYRKSCKYQLDGIVCKLEEEWRSGLGATSHHPNWALAIKFVAEEVSTRIIGIELGLGKTGQLTPVAILEPVELMGSTVQRASMYNVGWMIDKRSFPGAKVSLVKGGDIIPKIVDILEPANTEWIVPKQWNNHAVKMDKKGIHLVLENFEQTQEWKSIKFYNSIAALKIKGVGPALAESLSLIFDTVWQIFLETPESLLNLLISSGHFKRGRELEKLVECLTSIQTLDFWQLIYAQQYKNCGETMSKELAKWQFGLKHSFRGLEASPIEYYINDHNKEVNEIAESLKKSGINIIIPSDQSGLLTFEMTGDPPGMTKAIYKHQIESTGIAVHTSLKSDTQYLVTTSLTSISGKMKKAEKNGTKIVTYEEFQQIVNDKKGKGI